MKRIIVIALLIMAGFATAAEKTPWTLKLHEEMRVAIPQRYQGVSRDIKILRVPGGWVYQINDGMSSVFVPYCEEELRLRTIKVKIDSIGGEKQ